MQKKKAGLKKMSIEMLPESIRKLRQREDGLKTSGLSLLETSPLLFESPLACHILSCTVLDLHLA